MTNPRYVGIAFTIATLAAMQADKLSTKQSRVKRIQSSHETNSRGLCKLDSFVLRWIKIQWKLVTCQISNRRSTQAYLILQLSTLLKTVLVLMRLSTKNKSSFTRNEALEKFESWENRCLLIKNVFKPTLLFPGLMMLNDATVSAYSRQNFPSFKKSGFLSCRSFA